MSTGSLVVDTTTTSTSRSVTLTAGKIYRWNVAAGNSTGLSSYTTRLYFQTPGSIPPTPTNTSPGSTSSPGPVMSSSTVTLSWNASSGATYYDLGVTDMTTGSLVVDTTTTSLSRSVTLTAGRTYRWNVAAGNSSGLSSYTTRLYFQTPGSTPPPPTNTSPGTTGSPGPVMSSSTVTLSWNASAGATYYDLGVTDMTTGSLVVDTTTTSTSRSVTLSAGRTYRWNVAAGNSAGLSSYTTRLYFQTPAPPNQPPSRTGLNQYRVDTNAVIPQGGTIPLGVAVAFKATVTDPEANTVKLEIEIRTAGGTFTGSPTHTGSLVSSGSVASVTVSGLAAGSYGYKARAVDSQGIPGVWSNAYNPDFIVVAAITKDGYEDDHTPATSKAIANGATQIRSIHAAGNVDWVKFTVTGGASNLRIETTGASGDTELYLYGPNSSTSQLAYDDDDGAGTFSLITTAADSLPTVLSAGTYYIKIQEFGNNAIMAAYSLSASWTDVAGGIAADSFEPDDGALSAKVITNGATQSRNIHAIGNLDWAKFTIGSNGATGIVIETAGASGDTELWLYGPNSSASRIAYNDDGTGTFSRITLSSLGAGIYYIKVNDRGNNSTIAAYTLRATWTEISAPPNDGNDTSATASLVSNGQTNNASIAAAGDNDWYSFTIGSNGATSVVLETAGSSGDTEMWLYGPNSVATQIAYNDDANGPFSRISLASLGSGTYHVKIRTFGNNTIIPAYAFLASWTESPQVVADGNNTSSTATPITNEQAHNGAINPLGDIDWYQVTIGNSGAHNIAIETSGAGGDTEIWLYGPNNPTVEIAYNDDTGSSHFSRIDSPKLIAGVYYVKVQARRNNAIISSYSLRASWTSGQPPSGQLISQSQCLAIFGHEISNSLLTDLNSCLQEFSINTPARMRHFISQCAHESIGLTTFKEIASGEAYEGRTDLGNIYPGDGPKYKGAGAIQLTGRYNYQKFADHIGDQKAMQGVNYVSTNYPFKSSGFWWVHIGKVNQLVDSGATCEEVSTRVNGINKKTGRPNGIEDRWRLYNICVEVIP